MNFERRKDPKTAIGIGEFGKRGLSYSSVDGWIRGKEKQYHIKELVWAISGWYHKIGINISLFHFPCTKNIDIAFPSYVITAGPGEPTDYDSIYRKIEYTEILSIFWRLIRENPEFRNYILEKNKDFANFFQIFDHNEF